MLSPNVRVFRPQALSWQLRPLNPTRSFGGMSCAPETNGLSGTAHPRQAWPTSSPQLLDRCWRVALEAAHEGTRAALAVPTRHRQQRPTASPTPSACATVPQGLRVVHRTFIFAVPNCQPRKQAAGARLAAWACGLEAAAVCGSPPRRAAHLLTAATVPTSRQQHVHGLPCRLRAALRSAAAQRPRFSSIGTSRQVSRQAHPRDPAEGGHNTTAMQPLRCASGDGSSGGGGGGEVEGPSSRGCGVGLDAAPPCYLLPSGWVAPALG